MINPVCAADYGNEYNVNNYPATPCPQCQVPFLWLGKEDKQQEDVAARTYVRHKKGQIHTTSCWLKILKVTT